uniref:Synaptonemal complex protein SC65-like n=1 Tax=Sinocyclocheilus anshuiensis TaxID=1608454 RepID=A0A671LCR3_9TELE
MAQRRICLVVFFSSAYLYCTVQAQYEKYSFNSFPANDLMPLESAYGHALEMYAAQDWKQSAKYLELSLRLHRLLKDSEAHCSQNCSAVGREHEENNTETTLLIMGHIIMRAACLKRCKTNFPVFSKSYPKRETLGAFEQRIPYRYLQYVYYQMNELERAVSAAHSYLQRNPEDPLLSRSLNYYKSLFDTEEYLVHHEEKPCEALFLKAVKLYNSGDFSSSARDMELAAAEYFKTFNTCLMSCEGSYDVQEFKDFYPTLAVNDVRNAALCAASYMLFDANDQVMQQNMAYYRFHRQQWGLQDEHFKPRPVINTVTNRALIILGSLCAFGNHVFSNKAKVTLILHTAHSEYIA